MTAAPSAKRWMNLVRIGLTLIAVLLLVFLLDWPELAAVFKPLKLSWFAVGLTAFAVAPVVMAQRWRVLLAAQDVHLGLWELLKLTYLGFFWNLFLPGGTGGDLVKAYYLTHHTHRKAEGATTVLVDRGTGLVVMMLVAWTACLFQLGSPQIRTLALVLSALLAALLIGVLLYFSKRLRKAIRLDQWRLMRGRGGLLGRVDRAVFVYRRKPGHLLAAAGLTLLAQSFGYLAYVLCGVALGLPTSLGQYLFLLPISIIVAALPIAPLGVGYAELTFGGLFLALGGATSEQGVALALLATKAIPIVWALPGLLISMTGTHLPSAAQMQQEMDSSA